MLLQVWCRHRQFAKHCVNEDDEPLRQKLVLCGVRVLTSDNGSDSIMGVVCACSIFVIVISPMGTGETANLELHFSDREFSKNSKNILHRGFASNTGRFLILKF